MADSEKKMNYNLLARKDVLRVVLEGCKDGGVALLKKRQGMILCRKATNLYLRFLEQSTEGSRQDQR